MKTLSRLPFSKMIENCMILFLSFSFIANVHGQTFSVVTPSNHTIYFQIQDGMAETTFRTYGMPNYGSLITGTLIIPDSVEYENVRYPVTAIGYESFHHSYYIDTVILPNTITEIKQDAFSACCNLASVSIPNSVVTIGRVAFGGCHFLSDLTIGESVTTIGQQAFDADTALVSVVIPNSVVSIGSGAFSQCYSLRSVTIGSSVTSIGGGAFSVCPNLDSMTFLPEVSPGIGGILFWGGTPDTLNIIIPCGSYHTYSPWLGSHHHYTVPTVDMAINVTSENTQRGTAFIVKDADSNDVRCDSSVVVRAVSKYGYHFHQWSNGNTNEQDTLFLTGDSSIIATFAKNQYNLTVHSFNDSLGVVTGEGIYDYLDTAVVTAIATAPHYFFERWSDGSTDSVYRIVITGNRLLTAYFAIDTHTVSVQVDNIAHGSVSGGGRYTYGSVATITAASYSGFRFSHWSNGATFNPYVFAVLNDTSLTAYYIADGEPYQDTIYLHDTIFYPIHDTTVVTNIDTVYYPIHDTTVVTTIDSLYFAVHDTVSLHDTIYLPQYIYDTLYLSIHDTSYVTVVDTMWLSVHDTVMLHDTIYLPQYFYDTIYIHDTLYVGMNDVETVNVKIYSSHGQIIVDGSNGKQVTLFDISGRLIATKQDEYMPLRFDVPLSGTYLVRIGNYLQKIVVIK